VKPTFLGQKPYTNLGYCRPVPLICEISVDYKQYTLSLLAEEDQLSEVKLVRVRSMQVYHEQLYQVGYQRYQHE